MEHYIAFLRGINISGKNKLAMKDLRQKLAEQGLQSVRTVLNSGNISFYHEDCVPMDLGKKLSGWIHEWFDMDVPVYVMTAGELESCLSCAPAWWNTKGTEMYDQMIFLIPPYQADLFLKQMGPLKDGLEYAKVCGNVVF